IPDIIAAICDTLVRDDGARAGEGPYTVTNTRTLALYARTCRAFHRPAIKVLWKHMELTLEIVLLHCMPSDVWCKQRVSRRYFLSQVDRLVRFDRLAYYAPFINTLTFGSAADNSHKYSYSYHVDKSTLELSDEGYLALSLLAILSHLPTRCPAVVDLTFDTRHSDGSGRGSNVVDRMLSRAVCAWNLRHFKSSALDGATLRHLIGSPSLETLYINRPFNPWAPIKLTQPDAFSSLRTLFLHIIPMERCIELMQGRNFYSLEELTLHVSRPSAGDWQTLLRAIHDAHRRPELLNYLEVNARLTQSPDNFREPLREADIEPILAFPAIRALDLDCIGDLRLYAQEAPTWKRRLTLNALVPLALHCPELQHLDLDLDATGVIYRSNPPQPAAPHCLPSISMQWSPILSAGVVAGFLSVIFPNLMGVDTVDDAAEVIKRRWKRVGSMVQLFAALRDHERKDALGQAPSTELEVRDRWYMSESEEEDAEDSTD
ncbi:hypothetical protein BD626DRAFT_525172, partial [Schizophyllum amplum]